MKKDCVLADAAVRLTSRLVNCRGCIECCVKGGLVYVREDEVARLRECNVPLVTVRGVTVIKRHADGSCPMLDRLGKRCSIYESRPLCCRLFPLDVLLVEGQLVWGMSNQCPNERRHVSKVQGVSSEIGEGTVRLLAEALEAYAGPGELSYFREKEEVLLSVEMLEEDEHHWTIVRKCNEAADLPAS